MTATRRPRYSKEEFAKRGEAIFAKTIRPSVKDRNPRHFVLIAIEAEAPTEVRWRRYRWQTGLICSTQFTTTLAGYGMRPGLDHAFHAVSAGARAVIDTGFDGCITLPPAADCRTRIAVA